MWKHRFKRVVSLGYQPLANNLLNKKDEKFELYPLEVNYCAKCHNCQLSVSVNPKKCFQIIYIHLQLQKPLGVTLSMHLKNILKN